LNREKIKIKSGKKISPLSGPDNNNGMPKIFFYFLNGVIRGSKKKITP